MQVWRNFVSLALGRLVSDSDRFVGTVDGMATMADYVQRLNIHFTAATSLLYIGSTLLPSSPSHATIEPRLQLASEIRSTFSHHSEPRTNTSPPTWTEHST
jgi:hypothetical protein